MQNYHIFNINIDIFWLLIYNFKKQNAVFHNRIPQIRLKEFIIMRIAIFSDVFYENKLLKKSLYTFANYKRIDFVVDVFTDWAELYNKKDNYILFFISFNNKTGVKLAKLLNESQISDYSDFKKAEKEFMENPNDPLVNFNAFSLDKNLIEAGFSDVKVEVQVVASQYIPTKEAILNWFIAPPAPDQKTMKERFLEYFEENKVDNFIQEVQNTLGDNEVKISSNTALIKAIK